MRGKTHCWQGFMRNDAARYVNLHTTEIKRQDRRESAADRHQVFRQRVLLDRVLQDALGPIRVAPLVAGLRRLLGALGAQPEEVAPRVDMAGDNADRVDVGVARVDAEAIGPKREQVRTVTGGVDDGRVERQRDILDPRCENAAESRQDGLPVLLVGAALEALVLFEEGHHLGGALLIERGRRRDGDHVGHAQVLHLLSPSGRSGGGGGGGHSEGTFSRRGARARADIGSSIQLHA
jgi:hypothetical protein